MYKGLAAMDFDGTLYSSKTGYSGSSEDSLLLLGKKRICRAIVTGRNLYSFRKAAAPLRLPIDYLIFSSGGGIIHWESGKMLRKRHLEPSDVLRITGILLEENADFMIQKRIPDNHRLYFHQSNPENKDFNSRLILYEKESSPLDEDSHLNGASQFVAIFPPGKVPSSSLLDKLEPYSLINATSPINGNSLWLEIFPAHVHKGSGTQWLIDHLKLQNRPVMAVGNDYNDLELLRWAESAWVVGNSPEQLKMEFNVTETCEAGGVSLAIKEWLKSENL